MTTGWPRAALVDLDGTLCDSAPELAAAMDRVLGELGQDPAGAARVRDWVGDGIDMLVTRALTAALGEAPDTDTLRDARTRFDTAYAEVLGTQCPLYPGVVEGLDHLRAAGVATACITNKSRLFALPLLASLGVADRFDTLVCGDSGLPKKPDAAPLAAAAERLGVVVSDCVMIGDSGIDVAAARAAGCPAWCVRSGYNRGEPIERAGADAVYDRFDDLVDGLLGGRRAPASEAATDPRRSA